MKKQTIFADVETLEQGALDQFNSAMELDCVVQGALMPDTHQGYTLPIGAVVATSDTVFPSWVGYDIGCGMCAARIGLHLDEINWPDIKQDIFEDIYRQIPVGFKHHSKKQAGFILPTDRTEIMDNVIKYKSPLFQLGTLGGGNHFIEIGHDECSDVWVVLHSGSRGFGWQVARAYMALASGDGKPREGHFGFGAESENGQSYINDVHIALEFALANRKKILSDVVGIVGGEINWESFINRNHNHVDFFDGMWIHRKGATHAEAGMMGVIPGNMRDGSFIVKGLGNPDSLYSSSHGAGRVLGRKQAKKTLNVSEFQHEMEGIVAKADETTLDESPQAYKNIFEVMKLQSDLVEVIHHIKPLINIKG